LVWMKKKCLCVFYMTYWLTFFFFFFFWCM
jgi:hypothetical protein